MRRSLPTLVVPLLVAGLIPLAIHAQVRLPRLPGGTPLPSAVADRLLSGEPPISTDLDDAYVELPWFDRADLAFAPLPDSAIGGSELTLPVGAWEAEFDAFCFRPGTRGPSVGSAHGYLAAPLQGPQARYLAKILDGYASQPDLRQEPVQELVWGLLTRARFRYLSREVQATAARLLTPAEIALLDRGALDVVPLQTRQRLFNSLPEGVRAVFEAEASMRDVFARGNHAFGELERLAVTNHTPDPPGAAQIPLERWTVHPGGFLIRYRATYYRRIHAQMIVPAVWRVERDALGRMVAQDNGRGVRTTIEYDDAIPHFDVPDHPALVGFALKRVQYQIPGEPRPLVIDNPGWTLATRPAGLPARRAAGAPRVMRIGRQSTQQDLATARATFANYQARIDAMNSQDPEAYRRWQDQVREQADRDNRMADQNRGSALDAAREAVRDLVDFLAFQAGRPSMRESAEQTVRDAMDRNERAIAEAGLDFEADRGVRGSLGNRPCGAGSGCRFRPSDSLAIPGSDGRQRLAMSARR